MVPRILIAGFCALPGPDRAGVQLRHVVRALVRHHSVDVLVVRRGDQAYVERFGAARLLRVPVPEGDLRTRVEAFRRALRRQLEGADYDVVHFRDGWSGVPVLEMRPQLSYAAIFDAARSPMAEPLWLSRDEAASLDLDHERCIRGADLTLAPHEPAARSLAALTSPAKVQLCPPGVDVDAFDWEELEPKGPPRVLYLGSLTPGRGVRVLLRAWLDVSRRCEARLILAGRASREFSKSLQAAIRDLDLEGRVELAGEIEHEDVPSEIARAAVCVAPGAVELTSQPLGLFPTKLLEYMACQRAVVAPRRGTVSMLIRDGQSGLLFEPGQPAHLAEQILRLLGDARLRARVARGGYEVVRQAHTASNTRRSVRKTYALLAARSPWRERFLEAIEELPTSDVLPLPTEEVTEAGAMERGRAARVERPIRAFDSDLIGLDEQTDVSSEEATLSEVADVTRVEHSPLGAPSEEEPARRERAQSLVTRVDTQIADEWVVETRQSLQGTEPQTTVDTDAGPSITGPLGQSFVAGEVDVPTPPPERVETDTPEIEVDIDDEAFTAMTPPFGSEQRSGARGAARKPPTRDAGPAHEDLSTTRVSAVPPPAAAPKHSGSSRDRGAAKRRGRDSKSVDDLK